MDVFGPDLVKVFNQAFKATEGKTKLIGNVLIVQKIPVREVKTSGGIIMQTSELKQVTAYDSNMPEFVKVLAVGEGYYDEKTGKEVPLEIRPGMVIQVGKMSVNWFSSFGSILFNSKTGRGIGFTLEAESKMSFENEKAFETFMQFFYEVNPLEA